MQLKKSLVGFWNNLKAAASHFGETDPFTQAGFLAYTTIFALPGVVIIVVAITGFFYDPGQVESALYGQFAKFIGSNTSTELAQIVERSDNAPNSTFAQILGVLTLVVSSTTAFAALQNALNKVWRVQPVKGHAILRYLVTRILSLGMIAAFGFLLLVSLVLDAVLVSIGERLGNWLPAEELLFGMLGMVASFAMVTLVFALVFKLLPDAKVPWHAVWVGAVFTAVLFTLGKVLIGLYIAKTGAGSAYGAGGVIVIVMLWAYLSSLLLLFGAQYTYVSSGSSTAATSNINDPVAVGSPSCA